MAMLTTIWQILFAAFILFFSGCAGLQTSDYQDPAVSINAFRMVPSQGIAPRFEIELRIVNPNRSALELEGIAYTIDIEGHRILTGAANDLPVIDPYSEGNVTLQAGTDLFGGLGLIGDLMKQDHNKVTYDLHVKLDVGSYRPLIHVERTGEISLKGERRQ
jgi:LEA14-like dessication related protein